MDDGDEIIEFQEADIAVTENGFPDTASSGRNGSTVRGEPPAAKESPLAASAPNAAFEQSKSTGMKLWRSLQNSVKMELPTEEKQVRTPEEKEVILKNSALLKDSSGKPLFPSLYKFRMESEHQLSQSTQNVASAIKSRDADWKLSKQVSTAFQQSRASVVSTLNARGQSVRTDFGVGRVVAYDSNAQVYQIRLSFGTLYSKTIQPTKQKKKAATNLELNSAYSNWEKSRRNEVKLECERLGIAFTDDTMNRCFTCLRDPKRQPSGPSLKDGNGNALFPALYKLRQSGQEVMKSKKSENPCLLCSGMACPNHSVKEFRREGITVCYDCFCHLEYEFDSAKLPEELHHQVEQLVELYGRTVLLLGYSSQFMLATADSLEEKTKQHNQIGVGGSSAGLVSGVLGVAAAATILTPAGPPLLVASLVFGGSATAVQTGSEAYKYYCEPNQFANRILTLQGIAESILSTIKTMRDKTVLPYLDQALMKGEMESAQMDAFGMIPANDVAAQTAARAGTRMGSTAATSASLVVQEAAVTSRFVSRATTAAARTARFARFAGGALSAATIALEARELHSTVTQIQNGSPCEKAEALRTVFANVKNMPSATYVEKMCGSYIKVRSKELFKAAVTGLNASFVEDQEEEGAEVESKSVAEESSKEDGGNEESDDEYDLVLVENVITDLEAAYDEDGDNTTSDDDDKFVMLESGASLLERVKHFKALEARKEAKRLR